MLIKKHIYQHFMDAASALDNNCVVHLDAGTPIVRCKKCRTYMNPFVEWDMNGRRWRCNVCSMANETPSDYYCALDETNRKRTDANQRPELTFGAVEYSANAEYMVRAPQPPVYTAGRKS